MTDRRQKRSRFANIWTISTASLMVLGCLFVYVYYLNFTLFDCSNDRTSYEASDDGKMTASLIKRGCGATTDFTTFVYVQTESPATESDNWGDAIFAIQGDENIRLRWIGRKLKIAAPTSGKRVVLKKDRWSGVEIVYEYF
ncbi:hypothetical protein [Mesorhizobium sp. 128a]